jgi:hypothetical protein
MTRTTILWRWRWWWRKSYTAIPSHHDITCFYKEEYNKVNGLESAKDIWDTLKTAHEGDKITKITKRELLEGELQRFTMLKREDMQEMYNRLNILANQVRDS